MQALLKRADTDNWIYYAYTPSRALALTSVALFSVFFLLTCFLCTKYKFWRVWWAFAVGIAAEAVGYGFRWSSSYHIRGHSPGLVLYIIQSLCVILAPAFMAASLYMTFGRVIMYVGERFSPIRQKRVTATFVTFDILSFAIQGGGGSLYSSNNPSLYNVARIILIVGFLIQVIAFGCFLIFAVFFHQRALRAGVPRTQWRVVLTATYIGSLLILLRSIFRTIEFAQGNNTTGYLLKREGYYYGLETLPIILACIVFIVAFPGRYLPQDRTERLEEYVQPKVESTSYDVEK